MLRLRDLALQPDFQLGSLEISPSRRLVEGPTGRVHVEPLIMQALLLLLDARGSVVTREELFNQCWGAAVVGDDSLNRAVAKVRRILDEVASGQAEIETIPRTGYRLAGEILQPIIEEGESEADAHASRRSAISRRLIVGAGIAAAGAGLTGAWWLAGLRSERQFDELMERGEQALSNPDASEREVVETFERAVALNPSSARAWGILAMIKGALANIADMAESARLVEDAKRAAGRALAIDPKEPNALMALAEIEGTIDGWAGFDQKLRRILAIDARHMRAIGIIGVLTQGAGLNRESWDWNERAIALEPLSPLFLSRRALKLWILNRLPEADRVLDRLRGLWPLDSWIYYIRFQILALSGRAPAARTMLDGNEKMVGPPAAVTMWRTALVALESPNATNLQQAREAILRGARRAPGLAAHGTLILASLGDVDTAFEVANGLLLSRGSVVVREASGSRRDLNNPGWRWTPWLFTPPTAIMRADPRFLPLCEGIGLADYWRHRGVKPDYLASSR